MKVKNYIKVINDSGDSEKNKMLSKIAEDLVCDLEETNREKYEKYNTKLYEIAYGKKLTEDLAREWIMSMRPYGMEWTLEQTSNVLKEKEITNIDKIDFWAMMNAMYNDYYSIVNDDVEKYYLLAKDFLLDEDGSENKAYMYWKYCTKRLV